MFQIAIAATLGGLLLRPDWASIEHRRRGAEWIVLQTGAEHFKTNLGKVRSGGVRGILISGAAIQKEPLRLIPRDPVGFRWGQKGLLTPDYLIGTRSRGIARMASGIEVRRLPVIGDPAVPEGQNVNRRHAPRIAYHHPNWDHVLKIKAVGAAHLTNTLVLKAVENEPRPVAIVARLGGAFGEMERAKCCEERGNRGDHIDFGKPSLTDRLAGLLQSRLGGDLLTLQLWMFGAWATFWAGLGAYGAGRLGTRKGVLIVLAAVCGLALGL